MVFFHSGVPSVYPALEPCKPSQSPKNNDNFIFCYLRIRLVFLIKLSFALLVFTTTLLLSPSGYLFKHSGSDSWGKVSGKLQAVLLKTRSGRKQGIRSLMEPKASNRFTKQEFLQLRL